MREYDPAHDRVARARNCSATQTTINPPSGAIAIPGKSSRSVRSSSPGPAGIITGAATGIGAAAALALARLGARMILAGIGMEGIDPLVRSIEGHGGHAVPSACDVRDPSQVEALSNLAGVLRDRKRLQGKIRAMSSEAKTGAMIIGSLPPGVMALIYVSTPGYIMPLFQVKLGNLMLLGCVVWMSLGVLVMKKMISFKY